MFLQNLYDSHVHLMATGQLACTLNLSAADSWKEVVRWTRSSDSLRGDWRIGFGWDQNRWPTKMLPTLEEIDEAFPDQPIYLSRCDGHGALVNSVGLARLGKKSQTGLLLESDHFEALASLPPYPTEKRRDFLRAACRVFNQSGFTHVRDLGGNEAQFNLAQELENKNEWTLEVDWNFACHRFDDFEQTLAQALRCRSRSTRMNHMGGIKFFLDGSLGSETAALSQPYAHRCDHHQGALLWTDFQIKELLRRVWREGLDVAVHAIGDLAADQMISLAREISSEGIGGRLHLEHAEVLRPETIQKMKALHVTCHMQPCHWLNDRAWLDLKLGPLKAFAFPWEALRRAKVSFSWGSDSPVERPSLANTIKALRESPLEGIQELQGDWYLPHCSTQAEVRGETEVSPENEILQVRFDDRIIFQRIPEGPI